MEHIVRESLYPDAESLTQSPKLPVYLHIALILLGAFSVISLSTRARAQHEEPPPRLLSRRSHGCG